MSNPSVSVVMPVYNAGPFLRDAVASIVGQTFQDWELLAIDDGSSDGSWEFLSSLADPRIRATRNDRNLGACVTINRGIDDSRGQYIARMDADDIVFPERLAKQVAALEADRRVDLLGTGTYVADRELNLVQVNRPPTAHAVIAKRPAMAFRLCFGALMGKAEWWRKWRMDTRIGVAGYEFDLFFRSHRQSVFSNVSEPLYVYRYVGHTRSWWKMTTGNYYRILSILRNGFKLGIPVKSLIGVASMIPRPILWAIKFAIGSKTSLNLPKDAIPQPDDARRMKELIEYVANTRLQTKP